MPNVLRIIRIYDGQYKGTCGAFNYVQPFVTVTASLLMGLAVFQLQHLIAAILIFAGVWLVISARQTK